MTDLVYKCLQKQALGCVGPSSRLFTTAGSKARKARGSGSGRLGLFTLLSRAWDGLGGVAAGG